MDHVDDVQLLSDLFDKDWLEKQPEPASDCSSDIEHYVGLDGLGQCPWCYQTEA